MGPPARDDERTPAQRRADALVDLARANAQLRVIKTICGTGCEAYEHLAQAITNRSASW